MHIEMLSFSCHILPVLISISVGLIIATMQYFVAISYLYHYWNHQSQIVVKCSFDFEAIETNSIMSIRAICNQLTVIYT